MVAKKMSGKYGLHLVWVMGCVLAAWVMLVPPISVQAAEPGMYLVTVKPSYRDPETGKIEDPGNNEAIGQGMTEKLCGPTGLLEVDGSGNTWLTVRYYLSQFVQDVSFEERSKGSYANLPFQEIQSKLPVEGAADIDSKYGYSDYRMAISSLDSVFRGKAYIEPMGRSVVYFFTVSNPVPGSGDFITTLNGKAAQSGQTLINDFVNQSSEDFGESSRQKPVGENKTQGLAEGSADSLGGGNAADPVTGIPQKPGLPPAADSSPGLPKESAIGEDTQGDYRLETPYDLSKVPLAQARKLTKPMLESAVGITGVTGTVNTLSRPSAAEIRTAHSKIIMIVLLTVAVVLAACFGIGTVRRRGRKHEA